jgi:GntR family transcriptional repressor for pyruvate dehydrogenase complex
MRAVAASARRAQDAQSGVAADVIETLQRRIRSGEYRPGARLPSERAICEQLRVSRPTVREAIGALAATHVLESRRGSGVYVAPLVPGELLRPLQFALELSEPTLSSLFEVRLALEPTAAAFAAERRSEGDLLRIRRCVHLAERDRVSKSRFVELDTQLHMLIVEASKNGLLHNLVASLSWLSLQSRELTILEPGMQAASIHDHRAIVAAIDRRDSDGAEAAMRRHLERVWVASRQIDVADPAGLPADDEPRRCSAQRREEPQRAGRP